MSECHFLLQTSHVSDQQQTILDASNGIEAFQKYYLYLSAKAIDGSVSSSASEGIGPKIVQTLQGGKTVRIRPENTSETTEGDCATKEYFTLC